MPCRDADNWIDSSSDKELRIEIDKNKHLRALLCSACTALDSVNFNFTLNPALDEWWDKHKKEDEAKAKEKSRRMLRKSMAKAVSNKPFNQLTKDDINLLKEEGYL